MGVTIKSDGADGKHYEITLGKTGSNTGNVDVKTWNDGANHAANPPDKDDTTKLYGNRGLESCVIAAIASSFIVTASLAASPAMAQATRTWVSGVGDDANPCSRTACKTFAGAYPRRLSAAKSTI